MQFLALNFSFLYKCPCTGIIITEFLWRAAVFVLENPVEIRKVIEPALVRNFRDRVGSIDQRAGSMAEPDFVQTFNKSFAGSFFNKPAERNFGHSRQLRYNFQIYFLVVIIAHMGKYFFNPPAVVINLFIRKSAVGQRTHVSGNGQVM